VQPSAAGVLGIAPHSGWAAAVLLAGTPAEPRVILRERLELTEARLAGSKQPYHALEGLPLAQAQRQLARFCTSASGLAEGALRALLARAQAAGVEPHGAGILDSAGRGGATLAAILASHALIHTADGNHFRAALAQACQALGLRVARIPQRELTGRAAAVLRRSPEQLAATVRELGRGMGSPWGADQKDAALLAWLLLAGGA
jgi:hypothetical protein